MKKSILIGVLAAMMLVAFVACDNGTVVNPYDDIVVKLVVEGTPDVVVGAAPSASDYVVTGVKSTGEEFTVPAADLSFDFTAAEAVSAPSAEDAPAQVGTVTYVGKYYPSVDPVSAPLTANVFAVKSLEVSGPTDAQYYEGYIGKTVNGVEATFDNTFRFNDYTVSATYEDFDGEEHTVTLTKEQYKVTGFNDSSVAQIELTFAPVKGDGSDYSSFAQSDGKNKASIIIVQDHIVGWDAVADTTKTFYVGSVADDNVPTADDVEVSVRYYSGASEVLSSGYEVANAWKTGVEDDEESDDYGKLVGSSGTITVTYKDYAAQTTKDVRFDFEENTIVKFSVSAPTQLNANTQLLTDQVSISATWADEDNPLVANDDLVPVISNNGVVPAGVTEYVFKITLSDYPDVPAVYHKVTVLDN